MKEKLEILDGTRGRGTKARAAVRRGELEPLMKISHQLKSRTIDGAPTKEDYNKLRDDVAKLLAVLVELSSIQHGKMND